MVAAESSVISHQRGEGRGRILDEARTLFLERGFAATSMQEIADAVGMTKPALYYHFKDKQELLLAVLGREMEDGHEAFRESLSRHGELESRLEAGAVWSFSRVKGDLGRLMSDMHRVLPPERVQQFKCSHPMPVDTLSQLLSEAMASGEIPGNQDPVVLARLYVGMIFGQLAMLNSEELAEIDPERLGRTIARVFIHGVTG
jgi:AcrR family transcriptional regulator